MKEIKEEQINALFVELHKEAVSAGYNLNPDKEFTLELVKGLLINEDRYGYRACPCRLASGKKEEDIDLICPCDYRDADLNDYDACYCALYVSKRVISGEKKLTSIPDRRPIKEERGKTKVQSGADFIPGKLPYPVWRCKVCGYLCAKENPPEVCPVCKAKKDRFERFI